MRTKHAPTMFSIFRNRAFSNLWLAQLISAMGSALTDLAAAILVYRITGSALSVGLMLIATAGPTVLIGLFAGVFVDRFDRKRILINSDLLRAGLIFLIPSLIQFNIFWLYILVALSSAIAQFFDSAHASVLPEVASDEELAAADALMSFSSVASTTIGFAAAGILASSMNINWAFYLDGLSFLVSAALIWSTRIPTLPAVDDTSLQAIGQNLQAGLHAVVSTPILRSLFLVVTPIYVIFGMQDTLTLPFSLRELGATEFHYGLQEASTAVGVAIGCIIMAQLADRIREGQWLAISYLGMAVVTLAYALSHSIPLAILLIGVSGMLNAPSYVGRQLAIQRAAPREMRGRINSAFFVVRDVTFVIGMALAGLADLFNVRLLLILSSCALLVAGAVVLFLPALGTSRAQWKRTFSLLRGVEAAPRLGAGRPATRAEVERFIDCLPQLSGMSPKERARLTSKALVAQAPGGKIITYRGEESDAAYFILKGSVGAGLIKDDEYVILRYMREGEFFGEVAALTGMARTANIITEEESEFLILPSRVMQNLTRKYSGLNVMMHTLIGERLSRTDLPGAMGLDQQLLRELRTEQRDAPDEPATS
jgi:MFS family permease